MGDDGRQHATTEQDRINEMAQKAIVAFNTGKPDDARRALLDALDAAPDRIDLMHALAVCQLQLGEPRLALAVAMQAEEIARSRADDQAATLIGQIVLARAAACEDLPDAAGAEAAYREVLKHEPGHPVARTGLAWLLLAWGRTDEGLAELDAAVAECNDEPDALKGAAQVAAHIRAFREKEVHPREFLVAHREEYVAFFDHHAGEMAKKGWIAEAAKMKRAADGRVVPVIPEGARPYAAVRVDLVDPATGQPGQVGEQPMVVGIAGYESLSQAPVLFEWPGEPYRRWVSSQCPWDQLLVQIAFEDPSGDPVAWADATIGDWYMAGFDGKFGEKERGRFHVVSDPDPQRPGAVAWFVDCGRAELSALDDLFKRLAVLHGEHPIKHLLLGRGYLPL